MTTIVALGCGLVGEFVVQRLVDDGHSVVADHPDAGWRRYRTDAKPDFIVVLDETIPKHIATNEQSGRNDSCKNHDVRRREELVPSNIGMPLQVDCQTEASNDVVDTQNHQKKEKKFFFSTSLILHS